MDKMMNFEKYKPIDRQITTMHSIGIILRPMT